LNSSQRRFSSVLHLYLWLIIGLSLSLTSSLQAEATRRVQASGLGLVLEGDLSSGFEQAQKAAMRQAVEEAMGVLITSRTKVRNFAVIEDDILSQTEGYIRSFEVVEHGPVDSTTYQVTIDAVVSLGDLHRRLDALELLIEEAGNPHILCVGGERLVVDGQTQQAGWGAVATELRGALEKASARFHVVAPLDDGGELQEEAFDDLGHLADLGQQLGADIVVRGEAVVAPATGIKIPFSSGSLEEVGIKSGVADLRVEALWTDTGEIFAALTGVEKAAAATLQAAADKAIGTGIERLAGELVARLADDWREKVYSGRLLRLVVQGSREQLGVFERLFPICVGGVEKLYPRRYRSGVGVYDARSRDTGFQVARELSAKEVGDFDIEILQASLNSLQLQLSEPK